jgi:hypothetical protein
MLTPEYVTVATTAFVRPVKLQAVSRSTLLMNLPNRTEFTRPAVWDCEPMRRSQPAGGRTARSRKHHSWSTAHLYINHMKKFKDQADLKRKKPLT